MPSQNQSCDFIGFMPHECGMVDQILQLLEPIATAGLTIISILGVVYFIIDHCLPSAKLLKKYFKTTERLHIIVTVIRHNGKSVFNTTRAIIEHELLLKKGEDGQVPPYRDIARNTKANLLEITINNCYELFKREDEIKVYLKEIKELEVVDHKDSFFCKIKIENGFIAPIFLLTGLQDRFDEEWEDIIANYKDDLKFNKNKLDSESFQKLQIFLFYCWMTWGPSIPLCNCPCWGTYKNTALQYGYGDEDNSIPVFLKDEENHAKFKNLIKVFGQTENFKPLAYPVSINGKLQWGPGAFTTNPQDKNDEVNKFVELCENQASIKSKNTGVLLLREAEIIGEIPEVKTKIEKGYYSAYLWVIFVIMTKKENKWEPLYPSQKEDTWRGVITFFEHSSIADEDTYDFLSQQLASKALSSVTRILRENKNIGLYYACAVDDSHCYHTDPDKPHMYEVTQKGILRYLNKLVDNLTNFTPDDPAQHGTNLLFLKEQLNDGRFYIPSHEHKNAAESNKAGLSSCDLPGIIKNFYPEKKS